MARVVDGLHTPIWRHRDGRILDGRNRWRACHAAGVACPSRTFEGDDSEILAFVISQNLHRRHLDASQRAMIAAELANLGQGRPSKTPSFDGVSTEQAAKLLNVGEKSVERAKAVRRDAVPEVVSAVEQGQLSVSRAAVIARAEPTRQRQIVAGEEPFARLVPKPESRWDNQVGRTIRATYTEPEERSERRIRVSYTEPEEPTVVRVPAYVPVKEREPQRAYSATPVELHEIRKALSVLVSLSPKRAVDATPAEHRKEFAHLIRRSHARLTEALQLLEADGAETD